MDMKKVDSSTIDKIGYDAASQVLTITFDNGETYNYKKVPEKTYKALMKAKSKGKYFHKNIKDKFESEKAG
ncbi:MAG: KTSC domain-containing protein [Kiritimatiellae bacterium]|nr:KTSC domain-containing protein [Kiritimatiellia bacterium]